MQDIQKMYKDNPNYIIGFHGCDKNIAIKVIEKQEELIYKENKYDWLGHGNYFWENDYIRAFEFAEKVKKDPQKYNEIIKTPFVIGAIIDLGNCLNLLKRDSILIIKKAYKEFIEECKTFGLEIPKNKKAFEYDDDFLLRNLDCAVIEFLNKSLKINGQKEYDTIKAVFLEGDKIYKDSGFREKTHIQICVRNPNCIKGFFYPRMIT